MLRTTFALTTLIIGSAVCAAQSSSTTPLADRTPADNVQAGAVRERAPGRVIDAARARHSLLAQQRLAAQRAGDTSGLAPEETASTGSGGNPLNNLLGNLLGSGLLGGAGGLSDLLGGLTGSTGGTTGTTGGSTGNANIPSNIPPEALQMIADAGIDINGLFGKSIQSDGAAAGASAGAKDDQRAQTTDTTTEPKFVTRWADAMLNTLFTSLVIGFQTPDFINLLADFIRPVFIPPNPLPDTTATDTGTGRIIEQSGDTGTDATDGRTADPNSIVLSARAGYPAFA